MKSETPRTDAAENMSRDSYEMSRECGDPPYSGGDLADFARTLEREVNQVMTNIVSDEQKDVLNVTVESGKYTVKQDASGRLTALRYGNTWRDCTGDKLIYALAAEVESLRELINKNYFI